jgi:ABC-type dipeptide/oligopeptide/nickel transport system permease subunit
VKTRLMTLAVTVTLVAGACTAAQSAEIEESLAFASDFLTYMPTVLVLILLASLSALQ